MTILHRIITNGSYERLISRTKNIYKHWSCYSRAFSIFRRENQDDRTARRAIASFLFSKNFRFFLYINGHSSFHREMILGRVSVILYAKGKAISYSKKSLYIYLSIYLYTISSFVLLELNFPVVVYDSSLQSSFIRDLPLPLEVYMGCSWDIYKI